MPESLKHYNLQILSQFVWMDQYQSQILNVMDKYLADTNLNLI